MIPFDYIIIGDLRIFKIPLITIKKGLQRNRDTSSIHWEHYKDPKDKRKVLIKYDSIPETTKRKYKMPDQTH